MKLQDLHDALVSHQEAIYRLRKLAKQHGLIGQWDALDGKMLRAGDELDDAVYLTRRQLKAKRGAA